MAKMTFKGWDELALKLSAIESGSRKIAGKALYGGARITIKKVKENIGKIPVDSMRRLKPGEQFIGLTKAQKKVLLDNLGISKVDVDADGLINLKIGYDDDLGYMGEETATKKYPRGLPVNLIIRAAESGSSVRKPHHYMKKTIPQIRKQVKQHMKNIIDEEMGKVLNGGK